MNEKKTTVFYGKNLEEVATVFADIVFRHHISFLESFKASAMDDAAETAYWDYRLEHEPDVVRTKVYNRILDVMQHPEENRNLFVKRVLLRDRRLMSITEESGFYEKILAESKVIVPVNVEYIIDIENFRIDKVYHPEKG